jgi:hypothetical protein
MVMILFSSHVDLDTISRAIRFTLNQQEINPEDYTRQLYVFGTSQQRTTSVFLAPSIPNIERVGDFLISRNISVRIANIGNPRHEHWIALRRNFRRDITICTRTIILTWLHLNNAITW